MRFSLATLLLLMLWFGALMLIWERRESWIVEIEAPKTGEYISTTTSDGRRVHFGFHDLTILNDRTVLWSKTIFQNTSILLHRAQFLDNDTIAFDYGEYGEPSMSGRAHRRFPEWWWGHFYRPEVWLAIVLSGLLLWRWLRHGAKRGEWG